MQIICVWGFRQIRLYLYASCLEPTAQGYMSCWWILSSCILGRHRVLTSKPTHGNVLWIDEYICFHKYDCYEAKINWFSLQLTEKYTHVPIYTRWGICCNTNIGRMTGKKKIYIYWLRRFRYHSRILCLVEISNQSLSCVCVQRRDGPCLCAHVDIIIIPKPQ